ncbi:MAG: efflux RND transporter periplasmic adaptor subunit, partial [candidate division Zixibacteria bacterium]|nr:efflux RND transporter periplasmic adaptor subunit [candidate division Zixibacteria bacterium]
MKISKWHIISLIVVALIISGVYYQKNTQAGDGQSEEPRYKEFTAERGTFEIIVTASGVIRPIDRIEIKSKASGRIEELPIEEGDYVKKGALICRLDKTEIQAEVDQANADLDIAKAELKQAENTSARRAKLFARELISEEENDKTGLTLAQAKGKLVRAKSALVKSNDRLRETIVRAPIDGIILQKYVEAGQIISSGINSVSGGTALVDIANMGLALIEAGVDEIDVGKIRVDQQAIVVAEAYPRIKFEGKIIRIAPEAKVEQNVTLFDVVIEVDNSRGRLKSGMNASMEITIVEKNNALLAPVMALSSPSRGRVGQGEGNKRLMRTALVKVDGEFVEREVKIGMSDFKQAIVIAGLEEGDTLGVPMTSRLKADNDRLEQRIKSSRSFGA